MPSARPIPQYPDADPDLLVPSSSVFVKPERRVRLDDAYQWWAYVPGADWRHPQGPETSAKKLSSTRWHVAYEDAWHTPSGRARAFPRRSNGSSRREAGWRAPSTRGVTAGSGRPLHGEHLAGRLPDENERLDGWEWTSPVGTYPPTVGLYDMTGNVWEWTVDGFGPQDVRSRAR